MISIWMKNVLIIEFELQFIQQKSMNNRLDHISYRLKIRVTSSFFNIYLIKTYFYLQFTLQML